MQIRLIYRLWYRKLSVRKSGSNAKIESLKFHELNSYVDELKNQISIKKQNVAKLEKEIKRLRNELSHNRNAIRFEVQRLVTDEWA